MHGEGFPFQLQGQPFAGPLPPRFRLRSHARVTYVLPFHSFSGLAATHDPDNTGQYALTPAVRQAAG